MSFSADLFKPLTVSNVFNSFPGSAFQVFVILSEKRLELNKAWLTVSWSSLAVFFLSKVSILFRKDLSLALGVNP